MNKVRIKRIRESAKMPTKAYHSAGYDLYPAMSGTIKPGEQVQIPLGFEAEFPGGYVAQIDDKSGIGNKGLSHMAGVIDSDYRGEWLIILRNFSDKDFIFTPEKSVAQVLFIQVESPIFEWADKLGETFRGEGKFGSSEVVKGGIE
jgi:dUTP pyrophosphatase